ncbi:MAG: hypothetical protein ACON4O_06050 [Lentimonas sp.]
MQILVLDRWLSREAISGGYLEREPFAGNQPVRTVRDPIVEVADEPEIEVIVDQQTFQTALISRVGLDRHGYFVAFENVLNVPVRKRVGDKIYIKDSGPLVIPTFGIAQKKVSAEELNAMARSTIEGFKLLGVGTDRASDSAGGDAESSRNIAFIQKPGSEKKIFAQGDFVSRLPNLGLDKIVKSVDGDYIVLVDQFGAEYRIDSIGDADLSEKFEATAE